MMSLNTCSSSSSSFVRNSISGVSRTQSQTWRLPVRRRQMVVVGMVNSNNGRSSERNVSVSVDSAVKDVSAPVAAVEAEDTSKLTTAVGGGVEDVYGEDSATEEHFITPWSVSVASGYSLLRDPHHNKGLAFTEKERDAHYLRGLLPPVVVGHDLQQQEQGMWTTSQKPYQLPRLRIEHENRDNVKLEKADKRASYK